MASGDVGASLLLINSLRADRVTPTPPADRRRRLAANNSPLPAAGGCKKLRSQRWNLKVTDEVHDSPKWLKVAARPGGGGRGAGGWMEPHLKPPETPTWERLWTAMRHIYFGSVGCLCSASVLIP